MAQCYVVAMQITMNSSHDKEGVLVKRIEELPEVISEVIQEFVEIFRSQKDYTHIRVMIT